MLLGRYKLGLAALAMLACGSPNQKELSEFALVENPPDSLIAEPASETHEILPPTGLQTPRLRISPFDAIIKKYSRRYGFDWRLIAAQVFVESRFQIQARSGRGAIGLMQIMPGTAKYLGADISLLLSPDQNIALGCFYNRKLFNLWKQKSGINRLAFTLASYNAGRSRVLRAEDRADSDGWATVRGHLPLETRNYVGRIFSKYDEYKQTFY